MTDQERINSETQMKLAMQDAKFAIFMEELKQQREDIRRAQEKHDADMREFRGEIRNMMRHLQGLTVASMVGIAAIAASVFGFMWSSTRNDTPPPQNPPAQATQYQSAEQAVK